VVNSIGTKTWRRRRRELPNILTVVGATCVNKHAGIGYFTLIDEVVTSLGQENQRAVGIKRCGKIVMYMMIIEKSKEIFYAL